MVKLKNVSNARRIERVAEAGNEFVDTDIAGMSVAADLIEE